MLSLIGDVSGKRVLDAGCGHGYYSILFAREGAKVTGIDISKKMVKLAKENAVKASVHCEFFVCDMQDLSRFNNDTFDVVTSSIVVGYLDNIEKAFSEVFRVLKAEGIFTFSESHPIGGPGRGWWEKDAEGRKLHWNLDKYFERSISALTWQTIDGKILETKSKHRTIQDYFDALISAGFVVERLLEPEPIAKGKTLDPRRYERAKRIPIFILFKARKPPRD